MNFIVYLIAFFTSGIFAFVGSLVSFPLFYYIFKSIFLANLFNVILGLGLQIMVFSYFGYGRSFGLFVAMSLPLILNGLGRSNRNFFVQEFSGTLIGIVVVWIINFN